jgi:hypothetical protein
MHKLSVVVVALGSLAWTASTLADCPLEGTPQDRRKTFDRAQQFENAGNVERAFYAYVAAQEPICDPNPVEVEAAKRAAPLALKLGAVAEKSGKLQEAFDIYEAGGHYAAADRVLIASARANPDDPGSYTRARQVLGDRSLPAFRSNNSVRLAATGAYQPDLKYLQEVLAMPPKGVERALQKETAAFNEQYLREYVQLMQTKPADLTDFAAMQGFGNQHQALVQKWGEDPLKISRKALSLAQSWSRASNDLGWSKQADAQIRQRIEQRVATLTKSYAGAPDLLEAAIDYQFSVFDNEEGNKARVAAIKAQAGKLGDEANAKQRYGLAAEYYSLADQDAKAQAARDTQQKMAMSKMQPSIDQMQQQAAQWQKEFGDPAKVKAMQEQAAAMQESMRQQQQQQRSNKKKQADDLEKELGL